MKTNLIFIIIVLFFSTVFSQELSYNSLFAYSRQIKNEKQTDGTLQDLSFDVHGRYTRSVTMEKLNEAKLISDFIIGYPVNWIDEYVSVDILATCNGKFMKAISPNITLNAEQKNILNTVDLGTGIIINVKYKSRNIENNIIENKIMNVSMMVIPEVEAEYVGGEQQLKKYLRESVISKISETTYKLLQDSIAIVIFTVNEEGEIINGKISKTSGDLKTDKLLLEAIYKMPKWKPAKNSKGKKVKQEFEFSVGNSGC